MKKILSAVCTCVALMAIGSIGIAQETSQPSAPAPAVTPAPAPNPTQAPTPNNVQGYCQFQDFQNHIYCSDGDIILFQPSQWGNDQLPLLAIYFLCNPEKPIQFNRAAVVCTYQKKLESQFKDADQIAQAQAQQNFQQQLQQQENAEQQDVRQDELAPLP